MCPDRIGIRGTVIVMFREGILDFGGGDEADMELLLLSAGMLVASLGLRRRCHRRHRGRPVDRFGVFGFHEISFR